MAREEHGMHLDRMSGPSAESGLMSLPIYLGQGPVVENATVLIDQVWPKRHRPPANAILEHETELLCAQCLVEHVFATMTLVSGMLLLSLVTRFSEFDKGRARSNPARRVSHRGSDNP